MPKCVESLSIRCRAWDSFWAYTAFAATRGLRRLMCNELDQQVRQVTQRSTKRAIDPLPAGVCPRGIRTDDAPKLRFTATLGGEPEVELGLV